MIKRDPWAGATMGGAGTHTRIRRKHEDAKTGMSSILRSLCGGALAASEGGGLREQMSLSHGSVCVATADMATALEVALSLPTSYGQKQMQT